MTEERFNQAEFTSTGKLRVSNGKKEVSLSQYELKQLSNAVTAYDKGKLIAANLADRLNSYDINTVQKGFVDGVMCQNKTMRQDMFRTFLKVAERLAKEDNWDARDRNAINTSRKIMNVLNGNSTPSQT